MERLLSVSEREAKCYEYFHTNAIKNRDQLRECWKKQQIPGVRANFIEDIFSDFLYKKKLNEKKRYNIISNTPHSQVFVLSDLHIPYEDKETLSNVFDCLADAQPQYIVLLGDVLDCYSISRFCKRPDRVRNLQDEINIFYTMMRELKKDLPKTEIHYVLGNHENRLEKLVLDNPGLFGLKALHPEQLFRLDELGIFYHKTKVKINDFIYYHGDVVRKNAGYSAKAEYEDHKMNDGVSGHCFSEDVEILTLDGWKRVIDTSIGESVATINKQTKQFEWNIVKDKYVYDTYKELYHIKTPNIDLMVTDKHGLIGYNQKTNNFEEFDAKYLAITDNKYNFLGSAEGNDLAGIPLNEAQLRLLVNICADAHVDYKQNCIYWGLKKERKIVHLKALLQELDIPYNEYHLITGVTRIRIPVKYSSPIISKYFKQKKILPSFVKDANWTQARIILDEYSLTDGCKCSDGKNSYQLCTNKKQELDILQEIFAKNGMRFTYTIRKGLNSKNPYYCIVINTNCYMSVNRNHVSIVPYEGKVSCLSVDNGTLIVRSKGKTVVTQNTHRLSSYYSTYEQKPGQWFENGCLCKIEPDYLNDPDKANWQHGFTVIDNYDGQNQGTQILINNHKFAYNGKIYK